jgi:hypothetical protein
MPQLGAQSISLTILAERRPHCCALHLPTAFALAQQAFALLDVWCAVLV